MYIQQSLSGLLRETKSTCGLLDHIFITQSREGLKNHNAKIYHHERDYLGGEIPCMLYLLGKHKLQGWSSAWVQQLNLLRVFALAV